MNKTEYFGHLALLITSPPSYDFVFARFLPLFYQREMTQKNRTPESAANGPAPPSPASGEAKKRLPRQDEGRRAQF
jgi:hypothetical protein